MPFARRCTIVTEEKTGFLAIAYHKFPDATAVRTFTPALSPEDSKKLATVQEYYSDLSKKELGTNIAMKWIDIPAGDGEFELATVRGPATIERLHMKLKTEWPET